MFSVQSKNELIEKWNVLSVCLMAKHNLNKQLSYLMLLYYQYCYLKTMVGNDVAVVTSYFENNLHLNVVIVSRSETEKVVRLKRFLFKQEIYDKLKELYGSRYLKESDPINVDDDLLTSFSTLSEKYIII